MQKGLKYVAVTPQEWMLLRTLREVSDSALRQKLDRFMIELADFVREPRCPKVQADGVPCDSTQADCRQCLKLDELLDTLRRAALRDVPETYDAQL